MDAIEQDTVIETDRLRLRRPVMADAPRIAELAGDYDVARMTTRMPHPYRLDDALDWLKGLAQPEARDQAVFAVTHPQDGLVGMLGFHGAEGGVAPEIGYWLGKPWWGRGYATEAAGSALTWARSVWRKRWVVSGHFSDNAASGAVLCKAGFLYTGEVQLRHCTARGEETPTRMMVWLA